MRSKNAGNDKIQVVTIPGSIAASQTDWLTLMPFEITEFTIGKLIPTLPGKSGIHYKLNAYLQIDFMHKVGLANEWADLNTIRSKIIKYQGSFRYERKYKPNNE